MGKERLKYWWFEIHGKYGMTAGVLAARSKAEAERVVVTADTYETLGGLDVEVVPLKMSGRESVVLHQSNYWE